MRVDFHIHNLFRESLPAFRSGDPHLRRARAQPFTYVSPLMQAPHLREPGIFMITGGRQVGKTTFLKQLIAERLRTAALAPEHIAFLTGELIADDTVLRHELLEALGDGSGPRLLVVDEVGYVKDWDKAVKYLADAGSLDETTLILSGSDSAILRSAMKRFAGRRGRAAQVDFTFHPLSFRETVRIKAPAIDCELAAFSDGSTAPFPESVAAAFVVLETLFDEYLIHGGYLTAMADWMRDRQIAPATYRTYADWLRGDILKHNKQEKYLLEMLRGILKTYATQVSWGSLSKALSIEHHKTVSDYAAILEDMNAVVILEALAEHTLAAAPKKAKKLYFADPFIFRTVETLLNRTVRESAPLLAETAAVCHMRRRNPHTYYLKGAKGEVDIAVVEGSRFTPLEVKWTHHLRPEHFKQIAQYPNGLILGKGPAFGRVGAVPLVPLVWYLALLPEPDVSAGVTP